MSQYTLFSQVRNRSGSTLESPLVIFVLLIFAIFPLLNMTVLGIASVNIFLTANQAVQKASNQQNYKKALVACEKEVSILNQGGINSFLHMKPVGGYNGSGTNLYVQATSCLNGKSRQYGPNVEVSDPIDTGENIYEYEAVSCYDVQPFVSFSGVPLLNGIPGIGAPARLSFTSVKVAEYPLGLAGDSTNRPLAGGTASLTLKVPGLEAPGTLTDLGESGWNHPEIYDLIRNAGQKVVAEQVLFLDAQNPNWTDTSLLVEPGMKCWIDYRADGKWSYGQDDAGNTIYLDADGHIGYTNYNTTGFPWGSVLGKFGSSPTVLMGKEKLNYLPNGQGQLFLAMNDGENGPGSAAASNGVFFADNAGKLAVRVILTR